MLEYEPIFDGALFERERDSNAFLLPLLCGCAALTFTAGFGAWVLSTPPVSAPQIVVVRSASDSPPARRVANPYGDLIAFAAAPSPAPPRDEANPYGALVDLQPDSSASSSASAALLQSGPEEGGPRPPRLSSLRPTSPCRPSATSRASTPPRRCRRRGRPNSPLSRRPRAARRGRSSALRPPSAPVDDRNVLQKLFGLAPAAAPAESSLAYASPEAGAVRARSAPAADSALGSSLFSPRPSPPAGADRNTAVYDISARTVYLPDGTRLEAHSGLGGYLDDPRHVDVRMRGATPPHLYELQPRGELFHGVAALRLVPVGGDASVYGRAGLLAHSYMLGPNGDSNGCVSFKDYDAFLKAFQDGKVTRLAVVAKL
jgi:hypothetical protein